MPVVACVVRLTAVFSGFAAIVHVPFMVSMSVFFVGMPGLCPGNIKAEQCQQRNC